MATEKLSPGMQQYVDIKKQYPDAFCSFGWVIFMNYFMRMRSNAAQILEISLTSRNKNADNPIPYGGCPLSFCPAVYRCLGLSRAIR